MAQALTLYYDIGTTNMRAYLLDEKLTLLDRLSKALGAKDSAIAGSNHVLLRGMKELHDRLLTQGGYRESDLSEIYASGMATSPYGILEVPHLWTPVSDRDFALHGVTTYREEAIFGRDMFLVAGLKTVGEDISSTNNTRGEEIEVLGVMPELESRFPGKQIAVILPGSHTHILLAGHGKILGILSTFTGELFCALKENTILAPILKADTDHLETEAIHLGLSNLQRYGLNRALYIGHAMRVFNHGSPADRRSYCEAVISGGVITSLDAYCGERWEDCDTAVIVSNPHMCELFTVLLQDSRRIRNVDRLLLTEDRSAALDGLRRIIRIREEDKRA